MAARSLEGISHENNLSSDTKMTYRTQFKLVVQEPWLRRAVIMIRDGIPGKVAIRSDQAISNRTELLLVQKS
jgi:hypothetical protein